MLQQIHIASMKQLRSFADYRRCLLKTFQSRRAGNRLNAPYTRRAASFINNFEDADIAGSAYVCAAAEFFAEAWYPYHTYFVSIFFAEERHGSGLQRLVQIHDVRVQFGIRDNLLVYDALHFQQFIASHTHVMRKIETKPVRLHYASGLLDMRPQHLPQR